MKNLTGQIITIARGHNPEFRILIPSPLPKNSTHDVKIWQIQPDGNLQYYIREIEILYSKKPNPSPDEDEVTRVQINFWYGLPKEISQYYAEEICKTGYSYGWDTLTCKMTCKMTCKITNKKENL